MVWLVTCTLVLLLAVWWDLQTHRIPNRVVLLGITLGCSVSMLPTGIGLQSAVLGGLAGLGLFLPLYLLSILGAGDVKLLAAMGTFAGYPGVVRVALFSMLAGGILASLIALHHRRLGQVLVQVRQAMLGFATQIASGGRPVPIAMSAGPQRLPYAMAIALGTFSHMYINP